MSEPITCGYPDVSTAVGAGVMALDGGVLPAVTRGERGGGGRRDPAPRAAGAAAAEREPVDMSALTLANQLTLLRMLADSGVRDPGRLRQLGLGAGRRSSLAGITDGLDGLIARRTNQRTSLGAWLDPMADKLLLVTHVRRAVAAGHRAGEPAPAVADGPGHQPRRRDRRHRRHRQPGDGAADVPAVDLRQGRDGHLHRDVRRRDARSTTSGGRRSSSTSAVWASAWRSRWSRASTTSHAARSSRAARSHQRQLRQLRPEVRDRLARGLRSSGTFGSQPSSVRARVMSGWRTFGSSVGSGR